MSENLHAPPPPLLRDGPGGGAPSAGTGLGLPEAAGLSARRPGPEAGPVPGGPLVEQQRGPGRGDPPRLPAEGGNLITNQPHQARVGIDVS